MGILMNFGGRCGRWNFLIYFYAHTAHNAHALPDIPSLKSLPWGYPSILTPDDFKCHQGTAPAYLRGRAQWALDSPVVPQNQDKTKMSCVLERKTWDNPYRSIPCHQLTKKNRLGNARRNVWAFIKHLASLRKTRGGLHTALPSQQWINPQKDQQLTANISVISVSKVLPEQELRSALVSSVKSRKKTAQH